MSHSQADISVCSSEGVAVPVSRAITPPLLTPHQVLLEGTSCFLWDYLRRSGKGGFILPFANDPESLLVALIVRNMCRKVVEATREQQKEVTFGFFSTLIFITDLHTTTSYMPIKLPVE